MGALQAIWQAAGAAGGALALGFIVLLAIGLVALTALFGGAAVGGDEEGVGLSQPAAPLPGGGVAWGTGLALDL